MNGFTRVAVIDDDRLVRTILSDALLEEGFEVSSFATAEEALSALWETPVDAVVTDIFLPRMNGFDLLKELRTRQWARRTPCVAISAVNWPQEQMDTVGTAAGPNLWVTKPFDVPKFLASLKALIGQTQDVSVTGAWELNRRQSDRADIHLEVRLRSAREIIVEYTENISKDGLFIRSEDPLPLNTCVEMDLNLPYREHPFTVSGRVVRTVHPGTPAALTHPAGMAVLLEEGRFGIRNELQAFLSGFREGMAQGMAANVFQVVLAGIDDQLSVIGQQLLGRHSITCHLAPDLATAGALLGKVTPDVFVVSGHQLQADPAALLSLSNFSPRTRSIVVGGPSPLKTPRLEYLPSPTPEELSSCIAKSLAVPQRSHPRAPLHTTITIHRADGVLSAQLENVSLTGLGFISEKAYALDERIEVEFVLPQLGVVKAKASIRRVRRAADGQFFAGARFLALREDSSEQLLHFLSLKL